MFKSYPHILTFLTTFLILSSINSLHLKQQPQSHLQTSTNQQQQLNYLIGLQTNYAQGISTLNSQSQTLRSRLQQLSSMDDRIKLLQNAIISQGIKISQLSTLMIPNPASSGVQCQVLTQQQQQKINQQALILQTKIKQFTQLLSIIPDGQQKNALRTQIQKMKINLIQIQRTSSSQCQQNLAYSSVVYITNLYNNNNWTLGTYSMDQLIQQYYQNYLRYSNISNCPIDRPFLASGIPSPNIQSCSRCPDTRPLFDMSTKTCITCPIDQTLDINSRKCVYAPRNSNYTYGNNYRLDPLSSIPNPISNLVSCPANAPFFNGTMCVQCALPYYWQISQSKCYQCPTGQVFSINLHQCVNKVDKKLTVLNGTQWITNDNNPTRVWNDRQNILNINATTGQYHLCQAAYPFYDNLACISCGQGKQFNVDTLRCVSPPENLTYNRNLKRYVVAQSNKQMDPRTQNYITSQTLTDNPNIPNCNTSFPYYDQISCIYCPSPNIIFDYDNKICTQCPYTSIYNQSIHKCSPRPIIYIYGNRNNLLATPTYSIADYNNTLQQTIRNNPSYVPAYCQDMSMYAAITKCVQCNTAVGQYFNVQSYTCTYCDGNIDPITNRCIQRQYYFVNTGANNLVIPDNITLGQIKANNDQIIASNPTKYSTCPLDNPYPYNNKTICGKCPPNAPLYSIQLQGCTYCPNPQAYDPNYRQCRNVVYLTNYDQNVIITTPNTLSSVLLAQSQLNHTNLTAKCPANTPYTPDGRICINCLSAAPYFDIQKGICVICTYPLTYSVEKKGCYQTYYLTNLSSPRLLQIQNYTVINVRNQQNQLRANTAITYKDCPIQTPYAQVSMCVNCSADTVYNLKTQTCDRCPSGSAYWQNTRKCLPYLNITNVNSTYARIVQSDMYTLTNYRTQIQRQKLQSPTQLCPNQLPYSINGICQQCPANAPYFLLSSRTCGICDNYQPTTMTCPPKPTRYPNLTNFYWITNDGNADKYINDGLRLKSIANGPVCPSFYNQSNKQCIQCPINSFYNYDTKLCQTCPPGTKFDINVHTCSIPVNIGTYFTNIQSSPNNLEIYGGLTLNQIQTTQRNIKQQYPNSQYCPIDKPFYDDIQCIMCPNYKKYFNLRHRLCQVCLYGETLIGNDCINSAGNKVWQEPVGQNVYPFLFSKV